MLCAWGVLFAHSYVLSGSSMPIIDPANTLFGISLGTFCVIVFFAISGFLIQRSMLRSRSFLSYFSARALRLFPGLAVVILITTFILGPAATSLQLSEYITAPSTWHYFSNLNLLNPNTQFHLAGVFKTNPYPDSVNGSIWTLPYETWMYLMVALVFAVDKLILRRIKAIKKLLGIAGFIMASILICFLGDKFLTNGQQLRFDILLFISTFYIGAFFYSYRHKIALSWVTMAVLLLGTPLVKGSIIAPIYIPITIAYSVLVLAYCFSGFVRKYNTLGDYSYGLYIYAFPVQQSLVYWLKLDFIELVIASTLIALTLAIGSWHLIEKPALSLKRR